MPFYKLLVLREPRKTDVLPVEQIERAPIGYIPAN